MATQTTVLNLTKPAGNENALISVINSNMDSVDAEAGKVRANVAADYSDSSAYAVGDMCVHDGSLYRCNTAIGSGGETWNAAHWTQVSIAGQLSALNSNLENLHNSTAISNVNLNDYKTTKTYRIGNLGNITNAPSGIGTSGVLLVDAYGAYITQKLYMNAGNAVRLSFDGGTTWNSWDITALKSDIAGFKFATIDSSTSGKTAGTAYEIDLPSGFTTSNIRMITSCYFFNTNSNIYTESSYDSSSISFRIVATSAGKLNITPSGSNSTSGVLRITIVRS